MRILRFLTFFTFIIFCIQLKAVHAETTIAEESIFRMANGSYYHPATGKMATSKERLMDVILGRTASSAIDTSTQSGPALRHAVEKAQMLLQSRLNDARNQRRMVTTKNLPQTWFSLTLALWYPQTDEIILRDILRRDMVVTEVDGSPISSIRVERSNGVNSEYSFDDDRIVVLANVHPILKQVDTSTYELFPVIYTPYSDGLHTQEMVAWGSDYLDAWMDNAYQDLRAASVTSRAFPEKLLADVIDPKVVRAIAVIEHADNADVKRNPLRTIESVYVTLAGNEKDSYAYARSSAGALGLVQFIPSTYASLIRQRPELGLEKDFESGMRQPINALKAQIAYLDLLITEIPEITRARFQNEHESVNEYLVASYNGGSGKVRRAMSDWEGAIQGTQQTTLRSFIKKHASLDAQVSVLQKKIHVTKKGKTLTNIKLQLKIVQKQHDTVATDEAYYRKFALREETRGYILKYRRALTVLKEIDQTIAMVSR